MTVTLLKAAVKQFKGVGCVDLLVSAKGPVMIHDAQLPNLPKATLLYAVAEVNYNKLVAVIC